MDPALFQLVVHLDDFVATGGLNLLRPKLRQATFADFLLHPEKLGGALEIHKDCKWLCCHAAHLRFKTRQKSKPELSHSG